MAKPFKPEEARSRWLLDKYHTKQEGDSSSTALHHRACAAITGFFTEIWERLVIFYDATYICVSGLLTLFLTSIFGLFFIIPLTPAFTLHSISTSAPTSILILNTTSTAANENLFPITTNLGVLLHVHHSNLIGSRIYYDDSLHASLFHRQENISTFFLPRQQQKQKQKQSAPATAIEALFPNVSLMVDEWTNIMDHGIAPSSSSSSSLSGCGYVYLDLWFNASARFMPVVNVKDKLRGHCGEVKIQLCSSSSSSSVTAAATTVVHPFHAACKVHSDVVYSVKLALFVILIFLIGHFLCCSRRFTQVNLAC